MNIGILYAWVAYVSCIAVIMVRNRVLVLSGNAQFQKPLSRLLIFFILFTAVDGTWGVLFSKTIFSFFFLNLFTYGFHLLAALSAFMWSGYMRDFLKAPEKAKNGINAVRWVILSIQLIVLGTNLFTHYAFNITPECDYLPTPLRDMTFYIQFSYYLVIISYSLSMLFKTTKNTDSHRMHLTALFFSSLPLLFGIGQMKFPDAPFYSLGFMLTSVAIYGFNVTAEREQVLDLLHKKERNKLANVVDAFSTDYEAIYYVDLDTHAYQNLVTEGEYFTSISPALVNKNDFFNDVAVNIEKVIHPDDRSTILTALSKENLLKLFHDRSSFTVTYRLIIKNTEQYYQMKVVFYDAENDTKKVVIGVSNIDDDVLKQQETAEIITAVGDAYESIYLVDTNDGSFISFRRSDYLTDNYPEKGVHFTESFVKYIVRDVHPDYRELLLQYADLSFIKEELRDKKAIGINFYDTHAGTQYYEMRIIKPKKYESNGKLLVSFINRNELILQRQREIFITGLSDDYDSVYYGNLKNDSFESIRLTGAFRESHPGLSTITTYSGFIQEAVKFVHPDDITSVLTELSPDNIRTRLNENKSFYINYRQVIDNVVQYYRIKILRTENWEKDNEFMFGTSNVDELIRQQIEFAKEDSRKTSVLNAMASSYESICYVNINTKAYIPYFGTDNIKVWYQTKSYVDDFEQYVLHNVKKEYQRPLISAIRDEDIWKKSYATKQDASTGNAFNSVQFMDAHTGTPLYYELSLIHIDDNHIIAAIQNRDQVIRKEMEQKQVLEDAKNKAEAANRAKSTFLFNMSHDIRTPMNAIKGFTELAERNIEDRTKVTEYLGKVKASSNHLLSLINDVLDMSRIESGKVVIDEVPTNIKAETEKLLSIVDVSAKEKGLSLTYDLSNLKNNLVYSDVLHVNQVILNVLSNAIKYTKKGGSVFYSIDQLPDSTDAVASYCITVKDTGIGMSPEFLNHIFEEFTRESNSTKSGIEGTGLGMSIVKRLIDMMGGRIEIESELEKGTTVHLYLKFRISNQDMPNDAAYYTADDKELLKGKRLLLVEDNEFNREIAHEILADEGLEIEEAEDGAIAVEKVKAHEPDYYDFILMDIQMPYMDGYTATRTIRTLKNADYTQLPIIAMTANAFEEDVKNALDAGMNGHLSKPIDIPKLISYLKQNTH